VINVANSIFPYKCELVLSHSLHLISPPQLPLATLQSGDAIRRRRLCSGVKDERSGVARGLQLHRALPLQG